jgi:hypothetical protein
MAKKITPIKDLKATRVTTIREHERDKIEASIASAVHLGHNEISTHDISIDSTLGKELTDAGYEYVGREAKIKW